MKSLYKSLLAGILSLVTASSVMLTAFAADVRYGDVDANGKINATDALAVLKHSVTPGILSGDALTLADVNGDGRINSTDALEILLVSVGKRGKFTVEVNVPAPTTKEAVLGVYADAIAKARNDIPSYKLKNSTKTTEVDISGAATLLIPEATLEELKKSVSESSVYQNVFRKGTVSAMDNLPVELAVKEPSKFESITAETLADGNYKLTIGLYDETNPKAGSTVVKVMNVPDFDTTSNNLQEEVNGVGSQVPATIKLNSLKYENCQITCVVDSTTGEITAMTCAFDTVVSMTMTMGVSLNVDMTTNTVLEYSNFAY